MNTLEQNDQQSHFVNKRMQTVNAGQMCLVVPETYRQVSRPCRAISVFKKTRDEIM